MTRFIFNHFFDRKKTMTLLFSFLSIVILCALIIYPYDGYVNYIREPEMTRFMGKQMMIHMIYIIYPFVAILLMMDHDHPYLRPLIAYFGREKVFLSKVIFYLLMNFIILMTFWMMIHLITYFITFYHFFDDLMIDEFIDLYLDSLILMIFMMILIRDKHKNLAIVFGIICLLINFIQEDQKILWLYYIIPFKKQVFINFFLVTPYKICYIILGFLISYQRHQKEALT